VARNYNEFVNGEGERVVKVNIGSNMKAGNRPDKDKGFEVDTPRAIRIPLRFVHRPGDIRRSLPEQAASTEETTSEGTRFTGGEGQELEDSSFGLYSQVVGRLCNLLLLNWWTTRHNFLCQDCTMHWWEDGLAG